ncbi:probable LRR receptor-like serine/threonine-protein kinase At3g47570 [Coffea eugenioides]|uniref:probable LRR receptor-like serine/threonine-protein kinase At3g47570 n=1 Tax=Coffea eugenioides TaxID=49369 RepID=UPI000F61301F|nr:probable LRR receptor-like serine/threonine-protein kinase At3g47570 [Coffea eugenioides]
MNFITALTNCKYLVKLGLDYNPLEGTFPGSVGNLSYSVERIYAYDCELKANIPDSFGNLSNLLLLNVAGNNLMGPIPDTLGGMQNVQALNFQDNLLTGPLPENLCDLKNLYGLSLSQNTISGAIPSCLGNVTSLRYLYIARNVLNSGIPSSLWNLKDLIELNLSSNSLSGFLPLEIQNLKAATLIDISANRFIPKSFENLQYLQGINLSFNNLRGEIPTAGPFRNLTSQSFMSNDAFCGAPQFLVPPCSNSQTHDSSRKKRLLVVYVLLGAVAAVITSISLTVIFLIYRRKKKVTRTPDLQLTPAPARISYYELLRATNGYAESNLLGIGSCGSIYKGILNDGTVVAVKVFNLQLEIAFKSFQVECEVFRNLRHRNLTKVIGSCTNDEFKALVLEYMSNGSLEKWLYAENHVLDMLQRLNIMLDVAHALEYLHYGYTTQVVHCDLKPSNILLDEYMVAHVSDFGIAKLFGEGESVLHTKTLATLVYIAPAEKQDFVLQILELALKCCTEHSTDRINMKDVVASLERIKRPLQKFSGKFT